MRITKTSYPLHPALLDEGSIVVGTNGENNVLITFNPETASPALDYYGIYLTEQILECMKFRKIGLNCWQDDEVIFQRNEDNCWTITFIQSVSLSRTIDLPEEMLLHDFQNMYKENCKKPFAVTTHQLMGYYPSINN